MVLIILEKYAISMVYEIATNGFDSRWGDASFSRPLRVFGANPPQVLEYYCLLISTNTLFLSPCNWGVCSLTV